MATYSNSPVTTIQYITKNYSTPVGGGLANFSEAIYYCPANTITKFYISFFHQFQGGHGGNNSYTFSSQRNVITTNPYNPPYNINIWSSMSAIGFSAGTDSGFIFNTSTNLYINTTSTSGLKTDDHTIILHPGDRIFASYDGAFGDFNWPQSWHYKAVAIETVV